jgi:UDP-glucuronate decarboxylase
MQALKGEPITLYGDGSQTRSFCYVDDLVEGLLRMMDQDDEVGPVNVGNPSEITILELAETVLRLTGSKSRLVYRPLPPDDPVQRRPDISKARRHLDWQPGIGLEDGLKETIAYFRKVVAS